MSISLHLCRPSTCAELSSPEVVPGIGTFRCRKPLSVRCSAESSSSPASMAVESEFDAKVFRKNLTRSKNYNRRGFGHKEETLELMNREYTSKFHVLVILIYWSLKRLSILQVYVWSFFATDEFWIYAFRCWEFGEINKYGM